MIGSNTNLLSKLHLGKHFFFPQSLNSLSAFHCIETHCIILQILTCVGVQNPKVRGIWRYTSPSAGAYVTPVGRRKRQPESKQKRPTDSRNFPKGNRFRLPARPAYSRFSPIEQTFDSRIPSLRAIPNSTQIRYVSFSIQFWQVDLRSSIRRTPQNGLTPEPRTSCPSPCE